MLFTQSPGETSLISLDHRHTAFTMHQQNSIGKSIGLTLSASKELIFSDDGLLSVTCRPLWSFQGSQKSRGTNYGLTIARRGARAPTQPHKPRAKQDPDEPHDCAISPMSLWGRFPSLRESSSVQTWGSRGWATWKFVDVAGARQS